jgi:hypothetical protein
MQKLRELQNHDASWRPKHADDVARASVTKWFARDGRSRLLREQVRLSAGTEKKLCPWSYLLPRGHFNRSLSLDWWSVLHHQHEDEIGEG